MEEEVGERMEEKKKNLNNGRMALCVLLLLPVDDGVSEEGTGGGGDLVLREGAVQQQDPGTSTNVCSALMLVCFDNRCCANVPTPSPRWWGSAAGREAEAAVCVRRGRGREVMSDA